MPIITNNFIYEKTSETATKPVVAHRANVDFLTNCSYNCRGCFVNKGNTPYTHNDLVLLESLISSVNKTGQLFDELVFGPVDFFGAHNSEQLLREPIIQRIMTLYKPIFAIPTTLMCDDNVIINFVKLFNELYPHEYLEFELQVVVEPKKFNIEHRDYLNELKRKIRLFDGMIAHVCYTVQLNIQKLTGISLHTMSLLARDEFKTIIDYNPSFFRSLNPRTVRIMTRNWNKELERQITPENQADIQMVIPDWTHGAHNYTNWIIAGGDVYLSPFIHENTATTTEAFKVQTDDHICDVNDLTNKTVQSKREQYQYALKTQQCADCKYLDSCVGRHVLFYMKEYELTECMMPQKVLDMFPKHLGNLTYEIYDWSDYTTEGEQAYGNKRHHEFAKEKNLL